MVFIEEVGEVGRIVGVVGEVGRIAGVVGEVSLGEV